MTDVTVPENMLTSYWMMYPLAVILAIAAICAFFIIRQRMR
ncbi:hypothetical protein [Phyllobacterium sp. 22552]